MDVTSTPCLCVLLQMVQERENQLILNQNKAKLGQVQSRFPNDNLKLSESLDTMEVCGCECGCVCERVCGCGCLRVCMLVIIYDYLSYPLGTVIIKKIKEHV